MSLILLHFGNGRNTCIIFSRFTFRHVYVIACNRDFLDSIFIVAIHIRSLTKIQNAFKFQPPPPPIILDHLKLRLKAKGTTHLPDFDSCRASDKYLLIQNILCVSFSDNFICRRWLVPNVINTFLFPAGFGPRTVQAVASCYTDWTTQPTDIIYYLLIYYILSLTNSEFQKTFLA
jgi:hypothetical protein